MRSGKNKKIITEKGRSISLSPVSILEKPYFDAKMFSSMQMIKETPVKTLIILNYYIFIIISKSIHWYKLSVNQ
jgi:hypothetical protein